MNTDPEQRFSDKFQLADNSCWGWTAANDGRYGVFWVDGRQVGAHRWIFEQLRGPIRKGLQIDHLCGNKLCVNPDHMEAVTPQINSRRGGAGGWQTKKTHCPKGHEYTPSNTVRKSDGSRACKMCKLMAKQVWRTKKRQWILSNLEGTAAQEAMKRL